MQYEYEYESSTNNTRTVSTVTAAAADGSGTEKIKAQEGLSTKMKGNISNSISISNSNSNSNSKGKDNDVDEEKLRHAKRLLAYPTDKKKLGEQHQPKKPGALTGTPSEKYQGPPKGLGSGTKKKSEEQGQVRELKQVREHEREHTQELKEPGAFAGTASDEYRVKKKGSGPSSGTNKNMVSAKEASIKSEDAHSNSDSADLARAKRSIAYPPVNDIPAALLKSDATQGEKEATTDNLLRNIGNGNETTDFETTAVRVSTTDRAQKTLEKVESVVLYNNIDRTDNYNDDDLESPTKTKAKTIPTMSSMADLAVARPVLEKDNDMLPQAQEYVPSNGYAKNNHNNNSYKVLLCLLVTLVVIVVVVVLAVVLPKRDNDITAPMATAFPSSAPTWSTEGFLKSLLPNYISDSIALDKESAQARAFDWLMQDPLLDTHPDWRIVQKYALATIFYATGGEESWIFKDNWLNHNVHECLWYSQDSFGLTNGTFVYYNPEYSSPCEEDPSQNISQGTFKNLWLWRNLLQGTLPPELYLLTSLKSLSLFSNKELGGTISPLVGDLNSLHTLAITTTDMSGTLPTEVGLLYNLTALGLVANQLTGAIPSQVGELFNLQFLLLDQNNLTSNIPTELGLLTKLSWLYLSDNALQGSFPSELGLLTALGNLQVYSNQLTSSIPTELGLLTKLSVLYLDENALEGTIPTELGLFTDLGELHLNANNLTSSIPTELGLLTKLTWLSLHSNALEGSIPTELGLLTNTINMDLSPNSLTSTIPTELGLLTKLSLLYLFDNTLTGSFPTELGLLTALEDLQLDSNNLTSSIPTELGLLTVLSRLDLYSNALTSSIPIELGLFTDLGELHLYSNNLTSGIPSELGLLTQLTMLYLDTNSLQGGIPTELGLLTKMEELDLYANQLTSTLPTKIGQLTSLLRLFIDDNNLSSNIPTEVGLLSNMGVPPYDTPYSGLGLHNNQFEGKIPSKFGRLSSLPALWLQGNQLTGEVPQEVFALAVNGSLTALNLTGNHDLSGTIPRGVCLVGGFDFVFDCTTILCGCNCTCEGQDNVAMQANETVNGGRHSFP